MSWRMSASTPLTLETVDRQPCLDEAAVPRPRSPAAAAGLPPVPPWSESVRRSIGSGGRRAILGRDWAPVERGGRPISSVQPLLSTVLLLSLPPASQRTEYRLSLDAAWH